MRIVFKLTAANFPVRVENRKVVGRKPDGSYLVAYNGYPEFKIEQHEIRSVLSDEFDCILSRMLGAEDGPKKNYGYRNRYHVAINDSHNVGILREMEAAGLVREVSTGDKMIRFEATEAGCRALGFTKKQIDNALER